MMKPLSMVFQVGSAGSESGGSGADSITGEQNVSGRSSAYGDTPQDQSSQAPKGEGRGEGASTSAAALVTTGKVNIFFRLYVTGFSYPLP